MRGAPDSGPPRRLVSIALTLGGPHEQLQKSAQRPCSSPQEPITALTTCIGMVQRCMLVQTLQILHALQHLPMMSIDAIM